MHNKARSALVLVTGFTSVLMGAGLKPAQAQMSANELQTLCASKEDSVAQNTCDFYIGGVLDGLSVAGDVAFFGLRFCKPSSFTLIQGRPLVEKYMRANASKLTVSARLTIFQALYEAYPCPN